MRPRPFPNAEAADEERLEEVARRYPQRVARTGIAPVDDLLARSGIEPPRTSIVVVGTNGKTSTATFAARLLAGGGTRVGLTTSPHIRAWSERVVVDGRPVGAARLAAEVERLDALAAATGREPLRFFDLLTLAAARVFSEEEVGAAVFEAGIGGRLDAVRVLRPALVVLTGISRDHVDLLGGDEESILREKLGAAPAGALVVVAPLPESLARAARAEAELRGLELRFVETGGGDFLDRNRSLARAAAEATGLPLQDGEEALRGPIEGRLQRGVAAGVEYLLDAAHNEEGWLAIAAALEGATVAVVSVPADRPADALARAVAGRVDLVVATTAWEGRSAPAGALAGALRRAGVAVEEVDDPQAATLRGLERARERGARLAVFGSSYLLGHALGALERASPT